MARKIFKKFSPLLSFLLIAAIIIPFSLSPTSITTSAAFSVNDTDFDYSIVMSEPRTLNSNSVISTSLKTSDLKSIKLYPGGVPFGVKFMTDGILIVGFCDIECGAKKENPSSAAGLKQGDRIISVNGKSVISVQELNNIVEKSNGNTLKVVYRRNGTEYSTSITPIYCKKEGCYKTGIYVKDNGAGIGTVTYIVPETLSFAGLGHGICEGDAGNLVPIQRGSVVDVGINGVVK